MQSNLRLYGLPLHTYTLKVFIHLKMAMAELVGQLLKKPYHKAWVILSC